MATIIDGKKLAAEIRQNLKKECSTLKQNGKTPKLAVIMVGDNKASQVFVKRRNFTKRINRLNKKIK